MVMSEFEQSAAQRVPPHSLEAEESLLGAMLLSRDAIADAVEHTETVHFYRKFDGPVSFPYHRMKILLSLIQILFL